MAKFIAQNSSGLLVDGEQPYWLIMLVAGEEVGEFVLTSWQASFPALDSPTGHSCGP